MPVVMRSLAFVGVLLVSLAVFHIGLLVLRRLLKGFRWRASIIFPAAVLPLVILGVVPVQVAGFSSTYVILSVSLLGAWLAGFTFMTAVHDGSERDRGGSG
jgi:hypothetical protein